MTYDFDPQLWPISRVSRVSIWRQAASSCAWAADLGPSHGSDSQGRLNDLKPWNDQVIMGIMWFVAWACWLILVLWCDYLIWFVGLYSSTFVDYCPKETRMNVGLITSYIFILRNQDSLLLPSQFPPLSRACRLWQCVLCSSQWFFWSLCCDLRFAKLHGEHRCSLRIKQHPRYWKQAVDSRLWQHMY